MNELVKLVQQKAGVSEDVARTAVTTVLDFLNSRLPPQISGQLDSLISGNPAQGLGDVAQGLGGMFDKK
jgi:hypothetical protein